MNEMESEEPEEEEEEGGEEEDHSVQYAHVLCLCFMLSKRVDMHCIQKTQVRTTSFCQDVFLRHFMHFMPPKAVSRIIEFTNAALAKLKQPHLAKPIDQDDFAVFLGWLKHPQGCGMVITEGESRLCRHARP
eukprot:g83166.t1